MFLVVCWDAYTGKCVTVGRGVLECHWEGVYYNEALILH